MWSIEHLNQLKELTNHRVVWDKYEFVWQVKLDGKWQRHYIRNFNNYNTPMSWIFFNISKWNNEYNNRRTKYLKDMKANLEIEIKITEISRESNVRTKQKIKEIINLKPSISNKDIADVLGVTIRTVERHKR
tara:strand:- start:304 stop:699 length:396 start_codon:yes stop_codon:yes gene_type:complete